MTLFLASSLDKTIEILNEKVLKNTSNKKVLFIQNASDKVVGDKWWINTDREAFKKIGFEIIEVDLRVISKEDLVSNLEKVSVLHFCGGIVMYLMNLIKEKGFEDIVKKYVKEGKVIYTGTSAGSMIVSKDLSFCKYDPEEKDYIEKARNFEGLGFVDFLIIPHCGNADMTSANVKMIEKMPQHNTPLFMMYDSQAILVDDAKCEIVEQLD